MKYCAHYVGNVSCCITYYALTDFTTSQPRTIGCTCEAHTMCVCVCVYVCVRICMYACKHICSKTLFHSFIHSGDLYSASSRHYYSEALPAQSWPKKKDLRQIKKFGKAGHQQGTQLNGEIIPC